MSTGSGSSSAGKRGIGSAMNITATAGGRPRAYRAGSSGDKRPAVPTSRRNEVFQKSLIVPPSWHTDETRGGGTRYPIRPLIAIVVLLVLLAVVLGFALDLASVDPFAVGNELGFVQSPGWVYIYTPDGFLEDSWQAHTWFVGGLAWSPNGTEIVTTSNARYAIWDVATHNRLWLDTNASTWGDSVDWS